MKTKIIPFTSVFLFCAAFSGAFTAMAYAQGGVPLGCLSSPPSFGVTFIRNGIGMLFQFILGDFVAILLIISGIGAMAAAGTRRFRSAFRMTAVAAGIFNLRCLVALLFGSDFPDAEI